MLYILKMSLLPVHCVRRQCMAKKKCILFYQVVIIPAQNKVRYIVVVEFQQIHMLENVKLILSIMFAKRIWKKCKTQMQIHIYIIANIGQNMRAQIHWNCKIHMDRIQSHFLTYLSFMLARKFIHTRWIHSLLITKIISYFYPKNLFWNSLIVWRYFHFSTLI